MISVYPVPFRHPLKRFTTAPSISLAMLHTVVDLCLPFLNLQAVSLGNNRLTAVIPVYSVARNH